LENPITAVPPGAAARMVLPSPWALATFAVALLFCIPILVVVSAIAVPSDGIWEHLYRTVLADYVRNSLLLMIGVGATVLVLGVLPAWLVTMHRFPGSTILQWALLLPLAIPAYIIAYTYTGLLDVAGPLQTGLRETFGWQYGEYWFPQVRSLGGAVAMLALVLYPYVYLLARAAFIEQSICVLEVSRTLGCGPYRAFFTVGLPLARPGIVAGLSLVLMETLADYGTVQYFGVDTFTTGIFRTWFGLGSSAAAAQLSALLMLFILLLVLAERWSRRRARYHHTSSRYSALPAQPIPGVRGWLLAAGCFLPVLFGFIVPALQLADWAARSWTSVPAADFAVLAWNSVRLAAMAAGAAIMLALFLGYGRRLHPLPMVRASVRLLGMGYAVPGTVIAVGVLIPFAWLDNTVDRWMSVHFGISTGLLLSGTLVALLFAYLVRFLPITLNTVEAALAKVRPSMDEAARVMGLRTPAVLRRVHAPMMRGSLAAGLILVFVDVLKELPATLILRPFNFNTLAIRTYELANEERLAEAAVPALAIVVVGIVPVIMLARSIAGSRPGHDAGT
jgi:iron(III) transport system permease protein